MTCASVSDNESDKYKSCDVTLSGTSYPMSPETNDISYQKKHESGNRTKEELFPVVLTVEPPTAQ